MRGRLAGSVGDSARDGVHRVGARARGARARGRERRVVSGRALSRARTRAGRFPARNVIGVLRGSDPVLQNEYVVMSAHNDHVGVARQPVDHDSLRVTNFAAAMRKRGTPAATAQAWATHALDSLRALRRATR